MPEIDFNKMMDSMFKGGKNAIEHNSLFKKTEKAFTDLKLTFFRKRQGILNTGLDMGASAVKAVIFSSEGGVAKLLKVDSEEIPREHYESASRPQIIGECIKKLNQRGSLRGNVYVSFDLPELLVETLYLPIMPDDELSKAIRWEAKEKFLVDEEISVIDYMVLGEVNVAQQAHKEVMFFSAPKKDITENCKLLVSFGVRPKAIRPNFLSAFKAFENKSLWKDDEVVGLLDIGAGSSKFSVIAGGQIRFYRRFGVSGDSITRSIADYCRVSYEEAEREKMDLGMSRMMLEDDRKTDALAEHPRVRLSHAIGLHMDQLITEIQHTFNYFSLQVAVSQVNNMDRLIITGGGAATKGICDFFKSRLNIPVEALNPFNYFEAKMENAGASQLADKGLRFAASIGLAKGENP